MQAIVGMQDRPVDECYSSLRVTSFQTRQTIHATTVSGLTIHQLALTFISHFSATVDTITTVAFTTDGYITDSVWTG